MEHTALIINRVLPIFLLLGLGGWLRRARFIADSTIEDLRKLVVTLAMPSVLFLSFLTIELQPAYLVVFGLIFALCVGLFALGFALRARLAAGHPYFPFLITGFEYGMLGVSLFGGAYGLDKIGYIAVVDLGHELFIWFVFLAFLLMRRDGLRQPGPLVRAFVKSPVIVAVLAGIALNLLGGRAFLYDTAVLGGLVGTLEFLSALTIPLILMIVGYGIRFDRAALREAGLVIGLRLALLIPLALILNSVVLRGLLKLDAPFETALFVMLILPPPFIVPLYMPPGMTDERRYVNNVLMLYTVATIVIFAVYFVLNPTL